MPMSGGERNHEDVSDTMALVQAACKVLAITARPLAHFRHRRQPLLLARRWLPRGWIVGRVPGSVIFSYVWYRLWVPARFAHNSQLQASNENPIKLFKSRRARSVFFAERVQVLVQAYKKSEPVNVCKSSLRDHNLRYAITTGPS